MQWAKVKSILIMILLAVDIFLVGVLCVKWFSNKAREYQQMQNLQIVLKNNDVTMSNMDLPKNMMMPQLIVDKSRTDEMKFTNMLLGEDAPRIESESGLKIQNENGEVSWSDNCKIDALLTPKDYKKPEKTEVKKHALDILKKCNIDLSELDINIEQYNVKISEKIADYEVFNRNINIQFNDNNIKIDGIWTFAKPYATRRNIYANYNPIDSLVWFSRQQVAKNVYSMEAGLLLTNSAGNQMQLSPVWKIETENGIFYIDAANIEFL